jgi:putative flippase GtrA
MRALKAQLRSLPLVGPLLRHRVTKFGSVGLSGTLVNLSMLYLGQEHLFAAVADPGRRLDLSLSLAVSTATLSNFTWNRLWTWRDRRERLHKCLWVQLGQYVLASWVAILLQVVVTKTLAGYMHYLLANVCAILLGAIVNYRLNDAWTFGLRRLRG